jgi:hypothetical protein
MPVHSHYWRIAAAIYSFYWDVVMLFLYSSAIGNGKLDLSRRKTIVSIYPRLI